MINQKTTSMHPVFPTVRILTSVEKNRYDGLDMNTSQSNDFSFLREQPSLHQPGFQSAFQRTFRAPMNQSKTTVPAPTISLVEKETGSVSSPKLIAVYAAVFLAPVVAALLYRSIATSQKTPVLAQGPDAQEQTETTSLQPVFLQTNTPAELTSAQTEQNQTATTYEYELSLSNSFLRKAVELSNKANAQTPEDKALIVQYLNQALESANRAIAANATDPRGYSARGRVYQASSSVKPEMKQLADADFAKAAELGATNPIASPTQTNPIDHLPTEQATNTTADAAVIAAPEETQQSTVTTETKTNAKQGTTTLFAQQTEIFVPLTSVSNETKIYVEDASAQPTGAVLYVKNKQAGTGFTIAATTAPTSNMQIAWKIIE